MKKCLGIFLILTMFMPAFEPLTVDAATKKANTLAGLRADLAALKKKKQANDAAKKLTQKQINSAKNNIDSAKREIDTNTGKMEEAKDKVSTSEEAIVQKQEDIKKVAVAYQMSTSQNEYLEFVLSADSITDLIYRYSVAEQLMDWQQDEIDKYEKLIDENKKLQQDLADREVELNKSIDNLANRIDSLGEKLSEYSEINMDINDEIKTSQEYINYIVKAGCGENEDIDVCLGAVTDSGFKKPLVRGKINSNFGYRYHPITGKVNSFHNAVDIGGNAEGTPVYAAAAGIVGKIVRKASCGGNSVYIYHTVNGKKYTTQYTHLLSINVNIGDVVTSSSIIGKVGGGSTAKKNGGYDRCTTGPHLHFAMANGHYGGSGSDSYSTYAVYLTRCFDPQKFLGLPANGKLWSSR